MTTQKLTIGKAIDQIVDALSTLDKKEQQTVIATVCSFLELSSIGSSSPVAIDPVGLPSKSSQATHVEMPATMPAAHGFKHGLDIRTLKDQKKPDSARQMACIVAYYLLDHAPEADKKQTINTADIEQYFKQAGYKLPTKLEQLLIDCKRAGYFEASTRGEYKLTRVGYNLVTHSMPKGTKE